MLMGFDTLSVNHFYVANDLSVHFAPMPHPADGESKVPKMRYRNSRGLGESDPSAFKGAIQALSASQEEETLCIGFGAVERSCPSRGRIPPNGGSNCRPMARLQMVSPESVETRLQIFTLQTPERPSGRGTSLPAEDTWPRDTRLALFQQALSHPFATAVAEREMELAQSVLELTRGTQQPAGLRENFERGAMGRTIQRFAKKALVQRKSGGKQKILASLSQPQEELDSTEGAFLVFQKRLSKPPKTRRPSKMPSESLRKESIGSFSTICTST